MGLRTRNSFLRYTDERNELEPQKFGADDTDVEYNRLFKFGTFMSNRSGDIEPRSLKNSLQNGR